MENRGQSDCECLSLKINYYYLKWPCDNKCHSLFLVHDPVDTPLSESRYSEILEGWVQEDREVFEEHDAEALNELDNHDHDNEPFEEEPDVSEEEADDQHDDEDQEAHQEEEEEEEDNATAEEQDPESEAEDDNNDDDDEEEVEEESDRDLPSVDRYKRDTVKPEPEVNDVDEADSEEEDAADPDDDNDASVEEVEPKQENAHVPFEEVPFLFSSDFILIVV